MCTVSKRLDGAGKHYARRDDRPTTDVYSMCPAVAVPLQYACPELHPFNISTYTPFLKSTQLFPAYVEHNNNTFSHNNK